MTSKTFSAFLLLFVASGAFASACGQLEIDVPSTAGGEAGGSTAGGDAASGAGGTSDGGGGAGGEGPVAGAGGEAATCLPPDENTWHGCFQGQPCYVCEEDIAGYPLYLRRHPQCTSWYACDHSEHSDCSPDCPPPGQADQCDGTPGNWAGCRGLGCWVCSEKVADFPNYFKNHPFCISNSTCAGGYAACSAACPEPTEADR